MLIYYLLLLILFSVIAEFKKKTSSGVEDIIVGSLADNVTLDV